MIMILIKKLRYFLVADRGLGRGLGRGRGLDRDR